jgi:hypothetical protein
MWYSILEDDIPGKGPSFFSTSKRLIVVIVFLLSASYVTLSAGQEILGASELNFKFNSH